MQQAIQWMQRTALILIVLFFALGLSSRAQPEESLPDLIIEDVAMAPASPKPGDTLTITLTLANQGQESVRTRFDVEFQISFGPPELSEIGLGILTGVRVAKQTVTTPIPAGGRTQVTFQWQVLELPRFRFILIVDFPFNQIQESNERNNRREQILDIQEAFLNQWWLKTIDVASAWQITRGSSDVVVAVIDTGVDQKHPEFVGNLWTNPTDGSHGFDFIDKSNGLVRRTPIDFHGSSVAGLIAARDDGQGVTGVAPRTQIMDLRVFPTDGGARFSDITAAIEFAIAHGADVINLSLGTSFCDIEEILSIFRDEVQRELNLMQRAIDAALSRGIVVVASAGNNGRCVTFPARFPGVIAVSATTKTDGSPRFTSIGPEVLVGAPGGSLSLQEFIDAFKGDFQQLIPVLSSLLITPYLGGNYGWFTGTSASAPIVSGVVALMRSINPNLTPEQIRRVLAATALDLGAPGRDDRFGAGLVQAGRAVQCVAHNLNCLP